MMKHKRFIGILLGVALILLIPLVAMQFTTEVNWTSLDFLVMGALLLGTGLSCEFVIRNVRNKDYQIGAIAVILVVLVLVWAELAVGIFGSPFAGS